MRGIRPRRVRVAARCEQVGVNVKVSASYLYDKAVRSRVNIIWKVSAMQTIGHADSNIRLTD